MELIQPRTQKAPSRFVVRVTPDEKEVGHLLGDLETRRKRGNGFRVGLP